MQWPMRRASWVGLLALSVLVSTLAFLAYRYSADLSRTRAVIDHTSEVGDALATLLSALTEAEVGQRGFLVTGDKADLEPYHVALTAVPKQLRRIEKLVAGDPRLASRAAQLTKLANGEMAELERVLQVEQTSGLRAAMDAVRGQNGGALMREIRRRIDEMVEEAESGDTTDRLLADRAERASIAVLIVIALFSLLGIAMAGWTMIVELEERRRTMVELARLKEAAEAADAAKSRFIAFLTHEFRSPLTSIIGFSELLDRQSFGPLGSPRYVEYSSRIRRGSEYLLELVNDVLDSSKIEAGYGQLRETTFSIGALLEECVGLLRPQADRAAVTLAWAVGSGAADIYADPTRLKQIITNLVGNAIKYTPAGGQVRVIAEQTPDGSLDLVVSDTGLGIGEGDLAALMEPYRQADNRVNRAVAGTGLGLPLTRQLVELHGGKLVLESVPGAGTRAIVSLPADRLKRAA
jgi:signal transduction histidine kinase